MKSIISVFLIIYMMISSFFGSFSAVNEDIINSYDKFSENSLSDDQIDMLRTFIDAETSWIASLQLENGAIPMYASDNGTVSVNPYFADIAAMALLDNADKYSENVRLYMEWHFAHLNTSESDYNGVDGTIYDYSVEIKDGKIIEESITVKDGKNSYDSTDSYAATFLILLNKYFSVTGDNEYILMHSNDIIRIIEAMLSTLDRGLTYAKPDYEVKYLMDNCEVYEGLEASLSIFENILTENVNCNLTYLKCKYAYELMKQSIEKYLWNEESGNYNSAVFNNGSPAYEFSWNEFYPSATAQLFPVIHGVIPHNSERAISLYESFCLNYNWQQLDIPSEFCWGAIVLAAAEMNDIDSVLEYINSYKLYSESRDYPLYNADAARVSMAAATLLSK